MTAPPATFASELAGRYAIERLLGTGGMAHVWLAHDVRHDRRVALKVLRQDLGAALGPERFLAEIRTTAQLAHPHILPLLDSGEAAGLLWFAMPFVEGETLRARLRRETQLAVPDAIQLAGEVASALEAAHRRGIIHRDVKPENILLQDGAALVADFGIALAVRGGGGVRLTETGLSLGTPHYMSPEQAAGGRDVDARSDVYAVGAVLYEMLTGEPPHTGATAQAVVAKVLAEAPTPVRTVRPAVSPALETVVHRALAKTPADRFRTAGELAAALAAPDIGTPGSGVPTRARGKTRPRAPVVGTAVAVTASIAALAAWQFVRHSSPSVVPLAAGVKRLQLTSGGNVRAPALTPDGQRITYAVRTCDPAGQCLSDIETRDLDGAGRLQLARGFSGINDLTWSPDGAVAARAGGTQRSGHELGLGPPTELLEQHDDRREHRHAAALAGALRLEHVVHELLAALRPEGRDAVELGGLHRRESALAGVRAGDVVGDPHAVGVELDAVNDAAAVLEEPVDLPRRRRDAVGLDELQLEAEQVALAFEVPPHAEAVAAHEAAAERDLAQRGERQIALDVDAPRGVGPDPRRLALPRVGGLVAELQVLAVDARARR